MRFYLRCVEAHGFAMLEGVDMTAQTKVPGGAATMEQDEGGPLVAGT